MTVSELIRPGDKIDIRLIQQVARSDSELTNPRVLKSSVCDVLSDNILEIAMPIEGTKMILMPLGVRFSFLFYTLGGMYECVAMVKERYKKDNLFMLAVELKSPLQKFQRRQYYRMQCLLEMQFYEISDEDAQLSTTEEIFYKLRDDSFYEKEKDGNVVDISGGGIRFISEYELRKDSCILTVIHVNENEVRRNFYIVGKIIACTQNENDKEKYETRVQFIFKDSKMRESIIQYIFDEERRLRQKKNG